MSHINSPRFTLAILTAAAWHAVDVTESDHSVEPAKFHEWTMDDGEVVQEKECGAISYAAGYVTLAADIDGFPAKMTFAWTASGDADGSFSDLYKFSVEPDAENLAENLETNFSIVDDDDEDLDDDRAIINFLESTQSQWAPDALALCPQEPIMNVVDNANAAPSTDDDDMTEETVQRDDEPSITFVGKVIGTARSSTNNASSSYSGSPGRKTTLILYRTRGGKFVCEKIGITQWQGEKTRYSGAVCDSEAEVTKFFGFGWLAKELYDEAGITASINVD